MSETPRKYPELVAAQFASAADPAAAVTMKTYMRDQFEFFGIKSGPRRHIQKVCQRPLSRPTESDVAEIALDLWARPEREFQYCGADYVRANVRVLGPGFVAVLGRLITTKSWWDTVDILAARVAGPLVAGHPDLRAVMERWSHSGDMWLVRTAILHQLGFKGCTDAAWLFAACLDHASSKEFFVRKAIGWALREYSRTDPAAVAAFVHENEMVLSGLSKREALRLLE